MGSRLSSKAIPSAEKVRNGPAGQQGRHRKRLDVV